MPQEEVQWSSDTAYSAIKRAIKPPATKHELLRKVYLKDDGTRRSTKKDDELTRKDQVHLARLRCGHHPLLGYWRAKIGEEVVDACRLCGQPGPETSEHVMSICRGVADKRPENWNISGLVTSPKEALIIWTAWRERVEAMESPPRA